MNITPRLDNDIPKGYTYILVSRRNDLDSRIASLKGKRDKDSKKELSDVQNEVARTNNMIAELDSGRIINLYFNSEKVKDISTDHARFTFDDYIVYKINPIAMTKTWQNYGKYVTYDLNSFKVLERIDDMHYLIQMLNEDNILKDFVLTHFLEYCYGNNGFSEFRLSFLNKIKTECGQEYLPNLYDFFNRFSNYDGSNYKSNEHRIKCIREAYQEGLVNLHHPWSYTECTIEFLLHEKAYDILDDFIDSFNENTIELMSNLIYTDPRQRTLNRIIKLCNEQSDNESVVRLMKFMNIKQSGIVLNIYKYDEDDRKDYVSKSEKFDNIEQVKRWLIKTYDNINMDKVLKGEINGIEFHDEDENWIKVELIVEE